MRPREGIIAGRQHSHRPRFTLQHRIPQIVLKRFGHCYNRARKSEAQFYVISLLTAIISGSICPNGSLTNGLGHGHCFSGGQLVFSIAPQRQSILLLARGVSDGDFGGMVALPLAIRQSQCGIGTSGTPIFLRAAGPNERAMLPIGGQSRSNRFSRHAEFHQTAAADERTIAQGASRKRDNCSGRGRCIAAWIGMANDLVRSLADRCGSWHTYHRSGAPAMASLKRLFSGAASPQ